MKEEWRDIPEWEGYYQVSNFGNIRSMGRWVNFSNGGKKYVKEKTLIPISNTNIYLYFRASKNNRCKHLYVHRCVALAFPEICGKWFEGAEVNHLDEDKTNNKAENLRWCTHKVNNNWGTKNKKTAYALSKPVLQFTKDGEFVAEYCSISEAERQTGIRNGNISKCCLGKKNYKSAGGFNWKYKF